MALDLRGRVALVTGAGNGLGRAYARRLAAMGARVVVNDLGGDLRGNDNSSGPAEAVVAEIRGAGGDAIASLTSVASAEGANAMVALAMREWGQLDIVVNNAGVVPDGAPIDTTGDAEWERVLGVHLHGHINVLRAAWPHLRASDAGRVVNTTSSTMLGVTGALTYATAKGGVVGLTRSAPTRPATEHQGQRDPPFGGSQMSTAVRASLSSSSRLTSSNSDQRRRGGCRVALLCHPALPCPGDVRHRGREDVAGIPGMAEGWHRRDA
jgi:NADP-dependent 3-hydroxy acid dehydrogenase YdfG